ncbi:IclR family transcriptional regulator [Salibacterium aidingense]|uniref:IclR family transcriptional regulator n=1 Tax=Salibacterium aidingense TaxID=384933 RepID=UPI003BEA7023
MNKTQTLSRALDILFLLSESEQALTVQEIAYEVEIPESTTYRLLQTLEQSGITERKERGKIGLGPRILDLARSLYDQIDRELFITATPAMKELTQTTTETSILTVRGGFSATCIQSIESEKLIRLSINSGESLPLHQGASGKAILAFEKEPLIEKVIERVQPSSAKDLREELEKIKEDGYSLTKGEVDEDVFGVAAPIYDPFDRVTASLAIAGPVDRIYQEEAFMVKQVKEAASFITDKLREKQKL